MTSQEAKGSFMNFNDLMIFTNNANIGICCSSNDLITIDGIVMIKTQIIKDQVSEQSWRIIQSEVTTHIFGLESIFTHDLPEV